MCLSVIYVPCILKPHHPSMHHAFHLFEVHRILKMAIRKIGFIQNQYYSLTHSLEEF